MMVQRKRLQSSMYTRIHVRKRPDGVDDDVDFRHTHTLATLPAQHWVSSLEIGAAGAAIVRLHTPSAAVLAKLERMLTHHQTEEHAGLDAEQYTPSPATVASALSVRLHPALRLRVRQGRWSWAHVRKGDTRAWRSRETARNC